MHSCKEFAYLRLPGPTGRSVYAGKVGGVHAVAHLSYTGRSVPLQDAVAVRRAFRTGSDTDSRIGESEPKTIAVLSVTGRTYRAAASDRCADAEDDETDRMTETDRPVHRRPSKAARATRRTGATMAVSG